MGEQMSPQAQSFVASAVEASEAVAEELKKTLRVDVDPDDLSEVTDMLAKQVRREAFRAANGAKYERELDEKYGILKDVILHPTVQVYRSERISKKCDTRLRSRLEVPCGFSAVQPSMWLVGAHTYYLLRASDLLHVGSGSIS